MKNIPIGAKVVCTDGPCGQSTHIIVNPITETVTHIVVKEKWIPHTEYMVPLDQVADTTSDLIRLGCANSELKQMERFVGTRFIETKRYMADYGWHTPMTWPYTLPEGTKLPAEYQRIPPGKLAVYRGTYVQATDGLVGQVDELLLDPTTGHITHLVLRKGHLWGANVLPLPISVIDHSDGENVYLTIDKQAVGTLPAIPVKLHTGITTIDLIVLTFNEAGKADEALQALKQLLRKGDLSVLNAAVLIKDQDGKTFLQETEDVSPKQGALFGAITGGLIGLLGGPVGAIVGAAAGATTGRIAANWIDMGFPDQYIKKLKEGLQPGTSALVILVEQESIDKVIAALTNFKGEVLRQTLTGATQAQLIAGIFPEDILKED